MPSRLRAVVLVVFFAVVAGVCMGGCGEFFPYLANLNPCGTILNCDPVAYNFVTSGYEGPGADPSIDPACTYPPYCANDPFVATQTGGQ